MKFRYLGIMSLKSSVMKTLLTNSCEWKAFTLKLSFWGIAEKVE